MKRFALVLAGLSSLGLMGAGVKSASAAGVDVRVSVPAVTRVYTPGYAYAPGYYVQPTYVAPPVYTPTYVVPQPVYTAPAPVIVAPAPVCDPVPVVAAPSFGTWFSFDWFHGHGHDHDRGWDRGHDNGHDHHR